VKRLLPAALAAFACAALALWWFSDRQVLKRRTTALLDTVTIEAGSTPLARGLQAAGLDGFLAPDITLEVPAEEASGSRNRDEVAAGFRYVAERAEFTRFEIIAIETIAVDGDHGTVATVLDAGVQVDRHARIDGRYRTEFFWHRLDGRWRIARVTMRPGGW
jgi:hypothetical protein